MAYATRARPAEDEKCPFCQVVLGKSRRAFVKHVGRHMEEIALTALPRDNDDKESDSHSADSTPDLLPNFSKYPRRPSWDFPAELHSSAPSESPGEPLSDLSSMFASEFPGQSLPVISAIVTAEFPGQSLLELPRFSSPPAASPNQDSGTITCEYCGQQFRGTRQDRCTNLTRHTHAIHSLERRYHCSECGYSFAGTDYLQTHLRKEHGIIHR